MGSDKAEAFVKVASNFMKTAIGQKGEDKYLLHLELKNTRTHRQETFPA